MFFVLSIFCDNLYLLVGTFNVLAKSFVVPKGINPILTFLLDFVTPFTTSFKVPSPPTATTISLSSISDFTISSAFTFFVVYFIMT